MSRLGDFTLEATVYGHFTTRAASGAPFALAGTPALNVYEDDSATPITAGLTLTTAVNGVTGFNGFSAIASAANGYAAGKSYTLMLSAGSVNGVSVVGEIVGSFTLEATSPLRPATAGRKVAVNATGKAGLDLDNTSGTLAAAQIASAAFTADKFAANFLTAAKIAADAIGATQVAADAIGTSQLATTAVNAIRDAILSDSTAFAGAAITEARLAELDAANLPADLDAALLDTGTSIPALIGALQNISVADIWTTQLTESYAADGVEPSAAQALFLLIARLLEFSVTGTTATLKKLDGATAAATATLDDAVNPTSITRAT